VTPRIIISFRNCGKMVLKDLGIPENITTARLSRKKETPIAVIKADILGAFLIGLYAILSTPNPSNAALAIAKMAAKYQGNWISVTKKKVK
jgi:lysozyme family protein